MVTLSVASVVLAVLVASVAQAEFHHFEHEAQAKGSVWPSFSESTKAVPLLGFGLAIVTVGYGVQLIRRPECTLERLLWFGAVALLTHLLWLAVSFTSIYLLHMKFYHWL